MPVHARVLIHRRCCPRQAALPTGALRPFGDYKGGGLALMCELLAGAVGGGGTIQPAHERTDHIIVSTAPEHSTAECRYSKQLALQ